MWSACRFLAEARHNDPFVSDTIGLDYSGAVVVVVWHGHYDGWKS